MNGTVRQTEKERKTDRQTEKGTGEQTDAGMDLKFSAPTLPQDGLPTVGSPPQLMEKLGYLIPAA